MAAGAAVRLLSVKQSIAATTGEPGKQAEIGKAKVNSQTLIAVRKRRASARWYRQLLACESLPEYEHRDAYDGIFHAEQPILQLHAWDEDNHPNLVHADAEPPRGGVPTQWQPIEAVAHTASAD